MQSQSALMLIPQSSFQLSVGQVRFTAAGAEQARRVYAERLNA
ncbi:MAG: hypothetical protein WCB68_16090 [Pyrinomonadaceae bacterium]